MIKFIDKISPFLYFIFRIIIAVLFFLHGLTKFTGVLDGKIHLISLLGLASIIELAAGVLIFLGLLTRFAAFLSAVEMLFAYFMVHFKIDLNPLTNNGEPAVLFFAVFLVLIVFGAGKFSIDKKFKI